MIDPHKKIGSTSAIALLICYLAMSYAAFVFYPKWTKDRTEATISWDASGYYMYLPAAFIYGDIKKCTFKDSILAKYQPTPDFQQAFIHAKSGNYIMKYSAGQAIVMSPFFVIGHIWASNSNEYIADGFSFPYQISLGFGMFLIALIGLFFLRKILLHYFKDFTVALVLILYVIGSNYINYGAIDQAMTHNSLFTIYTLLVWVTIHFYKKPSSMLALLIGLLTGLATLIRPTEIISLVIPILWGVSSICDFKARLNFFKSKFKILIPAFIAFFAIVIIQPLYWKYASGEWIIYSYEDQGFSWLRPHIWDYTMSYRCGWLRFSPMLILPWLGFILYFKKGSNRWAVILYSFTIFYITTAWDVWDYGGTAGRAMVQHYVILAFPLALLTEWAHEQNWRKLIFYPLVLLFTYLNIWWVYHAHAGDIQVSGATREYYKATVGRWDIIPEVKKLLDGPHLFLGTPKGVTSLLKNELKTDSSTFLSLNKTIQFSKKYKVSKPTSDFKWLRASADFTCINKEWDVWKQTQFIIKFYSNGDEVQHNLIRPHRFLSDGESKKLSVDAIIPKEWETLEIEFWNANSEKELQIKNLEIIGFNE